MEKFSLIFLDFDGVLNTSNFLDRLYYLSKLQSKVFNPLFTNIEFIDNKIVDRDWANKMDYELIKKIMKIQESIDNLAIVLSTSWRFNHILEEWQEQFFNIKGWNIPIIGMTKCDFGDNLQKQVYYETTFDGSIRESDCRGREICDWCLTSEIEIENYVILDDYNDFLTFQMDNLVLTNPETGITDDDVQKIIDKLSRKEVGG